MMGPVRLSRLKRLFLGTPLPTAQSRHERLGKATALAVFASDALSSVAYATEEILLVLILAGTAALSYSIPIGIAIAVLCAMVVSSYRQTTRAYPGGGGAYIVGKDTLGVPAGLVAGAALLIDYVLTVAVSVAAGVAGVTAAVPTLFRYRPALCVAAVVAIAVANLRGIRESGKLFAAPTYFFIGSFGILIVYGGLGAVFDFLPEAPYQRHPPGLEGVGLVLVLRAFSSGCTALTGVEAVSDGVPAFKPPEAHNARIVLTWLGVILIVLFLGIAFLAYDFGITPRHEETVVSQLARHVFGGGAVYFEIQAVTMLILLLAANTSFADFPRLSFFLARDRFIPRQFATQGDRLVFSNGILILSGLAALLLRIFGRDTHAQIPLYVVGDIHRGVIKAIQYAKTLSPNAKAVFVETDPDRTRRLEEKWGRYGMGVPLIVLTSPYRSLLGPLTKYVDHLQSQGENHVVTIVLPEFIPARWWQLGLHNQTAFLIKGAMLFRKNVIVTDVPYHLVH